MELSGAVGVVTGGARGLGKAIAEALAARGVKLALVDVVGEELRETASELAKAGAAAIAVRADITDCQAVEDMAERVRRELGPVDILINNAGSLTALGPVWEVDPDRWARDVTVNLIGTFLVSRAVVGDMMAKRNGYIISLVGAAVGEPHLYTTGYDTSKAGVVRLMDALAKEAAEYNVRCYAVTPGLVRTEMSRFIAESPEGRKWRPEFAGHYKAARTPPERVANCCLAILQGKADALTGRWVDATADFDRIFARAEEIVDSNLLVLRLRGLDKQGGGR